MRPEAAGFSDEDSGEDNEDSPVARFVGMGQIIARDVAAIVPVVESPCFMVRRQATISRRLSR